VTANVGSGSIWPGGHPFHRPNGWGRGFSDITCLRANAASDRPPKTNLDDATVPSETPRAIPTPMADELHPRLCNAVPSAAPKQRPKLTPTPTCLLFIRPLNPRVPQFPRPTRRDSRSPISWREPLHLRDLRDLRGSDPRRPSWRYGRISTARSVFLMAPAGSFSILVARHATNPSGRTSVAPVSVSP